MSVLVELRGLEVFGHHGVGEDERRDGRTFLYDVLVEVPDGALSDRLEDTVDYREIAAKIQEVSDSRSFMLIEALAGAVADALVGSFPVERVRVGVRKPGIRPAGLAVECSAATVERTR